MSVQFGRWSFGGEKPIPDYIEKVRSTLAPYGPDSNETYSKENIDILYRAFHTTKEARREPQPHICRSGAVITFDGRLDNRTELLGDLPDVANSTTTDLEIVACAFEKWEANCFPKFIGDWAISIWNPDNHCLILAKDFIGTRHLYYSVQKDHITWCTVLEPLVLFIAEELKLCEEYIAGWFSYLPAAHLTPYLGIHAVPPSSLVVLCTANHRIQHRIIKYWDFDSGKTIRYRTDAEYQEHFRSAFATAVQRRLRSDRPVLAELSGGMDSSSIVCMADMIIARNAADTPRLDTISWFDDSYDHIERDWNERTYFTKVEDRRNRAGFHINLRTLREQEGDLEAFGAEFDDSSLATLPCPNVNASGLLKHYAGYMSSEGYRVTLSGIGGDEVTCGDVPTPTPELQDLLVQRRMRALCNQLSAWATKMGTCRFSLLWKAARGFFVSLLSDLPIDTSEALWLDPGFLRRNYTALKGYPAGMKLFGPLPSLQESIAKLNVLRRLLASWALQPEFIREIRFPYLDRDLLEFLFAIPRSQLVGVGERRFLMKRSLVGIVPKEILNRRRKAFVPQGRQGASKTWPTLSCTVGSSLRIIEPDRFLAALQQALRTEEHIAASGLAQTLRLEFWLRHLIARGLLWNQMPAQQRSHFVARS